MLLQRGTRDISTFDKVLNLALEYHRLAFTLENVAHAFLILMVIFEALFKKDTEANASQAAQRIGRLLGSTQRECGDIRQQFFDNRGETFCRIRNGVAHGDVGLGNPTVTKLYPCLYQYVTRTMVALLSLAAGTLNTNPDYYYEINKIVEERFNSLPAA